MTISKTAPESVETGEEFSYTLTVSNPSSVDAQDLVVEDVLPANVTFVSASDGGGLVAPDNTTVRWEIASLAAGASATRVLTVTAPATAGSVENATYNVSATGVPTAAGDPVTTLVTEPPAVKVVISQVYGGGGGAGYYRYDYVELFNPGTSAVDISGWSLQYGSSTGNFASSASNLYAFPAGTSIAASSFLLVQVGPEGSGLAFPTTPDLITGNLNMSQSSGKVALANISTALGCGATATPCALPHDKIVDLVSYGASNNAEGGVTVNNGVALTNQQGAVRKGGGCVDTDHNYNDFEVKTGSDLVPRNTTSPANVCGAASFMTITKTAPSSVSTGSDFTYTLVATNHLGEEAVGVEITDSLPESVTIVDISDGGAVVSGNTVLWTIASLADGASATRTVTVTAPGVETILTNSNYSVQAANWQPPTGGAPAVTTVRAPLPLTPIGTVREATSGRWRVEGTVTVPTGIYYNDSFAIQDATGGIYISASTFPLPTFTLGDTVMVTGTLRTYNGMMQLYNLEGVKNTGSGTAPEPLLTSTGSVGTTQGQLIQVSGEASWTGTPPAPGVSNWSFSINDGSGPVTVYVYRDTGISLSALTSPTPMTLTGLSGNFNAVQIWPRYQTDIVTPSDVTPPEVASTSPVDGASGVQPPATVRATFNEAIDPATLTGSNFTLEGPSGAIAGTVSYEAGSFTAVFTPYSSLAYQTTYTAILTTGVTDSQGNALAAPYTWSFTTGEYLPYTPIADARAAGAGWTGTLRGRITVTPGVYDARAFAIQDETGGIYVYNTYNRALPPIALGEVVEVTGRVVLYFGQLQIAELSRITWIDSGSPVTPLEVSTGAVGAGTDGKLVQVTGTATWSGTPAEPPASFTFYANDGSGSVQVYIDRDTRIDMRSFTSGMPMRITAFSGKYNTTFQLLPRFQSDLVDLRPPAVTQTVPAHDATGVSPYFPLTATFNKPVSAATVGSETFTLTGPSGPVSGVVTYDTSLNRAIFTPSASLEPNAAYTAVLTNGIQDIYGTPMVSDYTWSFTTGVADEVPPTVTAHTPQAGAVDVPLSTNITVTFSEDLHPASRTSSNFRLEGPYGMVPAAIGYDAGSFTVTLDPAGRLLPTARYTMTVAASTADWAGLTLGSDFTWSFETEVEPPMSVYFGDLHNHTSYSDGSGSPTQALNAGKAAGFSFMAITDHSYAINDEEWNNTLTAVNTATIDGEFVALRGFEYTQGAEGHINVYNTTRHAVRTNTGCASCDYTPNLEAGVTVNGFYNWLATTGTNAIDDNGTVMQFNHPGWINFNDWTFHPEVEATARLTEVGNGSGTSYAFSEDEFIRALDYGWKVGATNNADTHSSYWGLNTDHRTGVLMPELTKAALMDALRERRTFASEDKNFSLTMKANGAWMGAEIANAGQIQFEITGFDEDGEATSLVQLITDQGKVIAAHTTDSANFSWQPTINITPGVHYFYVKVTQADGDRMVSSPVWTLGSEDISITDVVIQPTVPTIHNPSLLTARVTNRVNATRTVTVSMDVNGETLGAPVEVTVPAYGDAYANFTWQPAQTGEAIVTATLAGTPEGDNPDDNQASLLLSVTDEQLPLILIDAGHGNVSATGREMRMFIDDLSAHRYNVLKNLDAITPSDLNPEIVKLLIITAPQTAYTPAELDAIADFVAAGGSLWLCGLADYTGKVPWADTVTDRLNAILDHIETRTGTQINMRMNDDEVIDGNTNNGYVFGVIWSDFPSESATSIGINVDKLASWSLNSIRGRGMEPLTASTPGVQIVVQGDMDEGYTGDSWRNPFHTSNTDADGAGDAYIYNPTWVYPNTMPVGAIPLPMAAVTDLEGEAGRIMLYGDSNDPFTTFAYTAGDGKQNELFNLQTVMWLLGTPLQKMTIAEARAQAVEDEPDLLDRLVWVEGEITASYGEFFNVLYVQDETGGITVHAPAGDIDATDFTRGTRVRVIGTIGSYNGDTEIEFFEAEMVQVIEPGAGEPLPRHLSTHQAGLESNEGWLAVVTGTVLAKAGADTLFVSDGSGAVRVFVDGYNGDFADIDVNDLVRVIGLVSEDGDGARIRVRNYKFHAEYADDVTILDQVLALDKAVAAPSTVDLSSVVTYTLTLQNIGSVSSGQTALVDVLPEGVTFSAFVENTAGAVMDNNTVAWTGSLEAGENIQLVFTVIVDIEFDLYGQTITNTAQFGSENAGTGSDQASFTVTSAPSFTFSKSVVTPALVRLGDTVTYTLEIANSSSAAVLGILVTDVLPEGLTFGSFVAANGAVQEDGTVSWSGSLAAGASRSIVFTALVDMDYSLYGDTLTNTAQFTSANDGSGTDSAAFTIAGAPVVTVEKSAAAPEVVNLGDVVTYTLRLTNDGDSVANNVALTDVLPAEVSFKSFISANGATHTAGTVTWTGSLQPGETVVVVFTVTVKSETSNYGKTITNTVQFTSANAGSGSDNAVFTIKSLYRIFLPLIQR